MRVIMPVKAQIACPSSDLSTFGHPVMIVINWIVIEPGEHETRRQGLRICYVCRGCQA